MQKGKSLLAKIVMLCLVVTCCFALVLGATSCGKEAKDPTFAINDNGHLIVTTYDAKGEVKETKDLGAVTGLKGDKGDKGDQGEQGPKGEKGEDGKLEHGHEDVASEDYELQEANCQHDGKTIRVFADGCAELLTTEGGHDFSLAAIGAGEMPKNIKDITAVPDEGHDDFFEIDEAGNVTFNGTATATVSCLICHAETKITFSLATDYVVDVLEPTHITEGYRKAFINYTADGKEYENQPVEYDVLAKVGDHFFNGKVVEGSEGIGRVYTLDEIKEIFGDDYTTFTNKEIGCGDYGYASFVCEECKGNVLLEVRNNHKWGEPEVLGYNDEDGVLLKFVCGECDFELENYADESKYVASNCAAAAHVDWTYELDDVPYTGTYNIPGAEVNTDAHRYENAEGESTVLLVNREYRISDLDAIFDEGGYEVLGNAMNCSDTYGKAIFKCADCGKTIALENVLKDHTYELDEADSTISEDGITLIFKCKDCGDELEPIEADEYHIHEPVIDCENGDDRTLTYTYTDPEGESHTETLVLGHLDADENVHKLGEKQLDIREVYSLADLRLMFGEDLEEAGFEVLGNALSCLKTGTATFTCGVCGKKLALNIRGDHELELVDENAVKYNADTDEVIGTLQLHCKVCEQTFDTVAYTVKKDRKPATCKAEGYYKVTYTYTFDGEHTVTLHDEVLPVDPDGHTFGENTFSENGIYTMAQIKTIFGDKYELLGNRVTCQSTETGTVVVTCDTCNTKLGLAVTGDHDYKLVDSNFSWEGKDEGVEVDEDTLVQVYIKFKCQACDDEEWFKKVYIAKKVAQTNKEDGKIYVEYTYTLNGVDYVKEEVLKVIPKDPSLHIYTDKDGNVHMFSDDEEYDIEELREIFGDDLVEFDNDEWHAAFVCEDEECGLVLINVSDGRA